jgi:hemolysin activation/secretion protein
MRRRRSAALVTAGFFAFAADVCAAQVSGATRDVGSPDEQFEVKPPAGLQLQAPIAIPPQVQSAGAMTVERFAFRGASTVPTETLEAIVAPWTGRALSADDLRQALGAVTAHLRERGLYARP